MKISDGHPYHLYIGKPPPGDQATECNLRISSLLFGISKLQEVCLLKVGLALQVLPCVENTYKNFIFGVLYYLLASLQSVSVNSEPDPPDDSQDSPQFSFPGVDFRLFIFAHGLGVLNQEMFDSFEKN